MLSNISFIWRIYQGTCLRVMAHTLLQCWLGICRKYQYPSWLQFSHSWHSQYPLSFQQFNSRKLLLNVFIKGSIVSIRLPIYLHQSYVRQCRSLYAHLWCHKQIILAVSTNMLICYHSAFGKPIHQLHLMLAIEFHSSTMLWSINSGSSFLILLPFLFLLPNIPFIVSRFPYLFHFAVN